MGSPIAALATIAIVIVCGVVGLALRLLDERKRRVRHDGPSPGFPADWRNRGE